MHVVNVRFNFRGKTMSIVDFNHHEAGTHSIMIMISHIVTPLILGGAMTTGLFYLMQSLIHSDNASLTKTKTIQLVDFVRVRQLSEVQTRDLHPKKPPPPQQMPHVKEPMNFNVKVAQQSYSMQPMQVSAKADLTGTWTFSSDGNYLPIVKVAPIYPTTAEMAGLEGWVVLQFTVNSEGRVVNPIVVDDCAHVTAPGTTRQDCDDQPNKIFDQAALNAALKFKYKPKVEDGVAVATPHVRHKFVFVLGD